MTALPLAALALLSAAADPTPAPATPPTLAFDKSHLDNGLELIVHEDKSAPIVCVDVWYHVGAVNEEPGKSGFAHLFEHLMFKGSRHVKDGEHTKLLEAAGATYENGSTDFDQTAYYECVPKNEVELALWLEADRMAWLLDGADQKKLDAQRAVVTNERREDIDNRPYGLAEEKLWHAIFPPTHPYAGLVIGSVADLDRATLDDVRKFYDVYYAPTNATLALTGDIDAATAKTLVAKYFKTLPKWQKPKPVTVPAPVIAKELRLDEEDPLASLAKVEIYYLTPRIFEKDNADLDVLARILADGNASRLHSALMVDAQLAQDVSAEQESYGAASVFHVDITVAPGVEPDVVVNAIRAQLDLLIDLPPDQDEINRVVNTLESDAVLALQTPLGRAENLQRYNHYTGDPGFFAKDIARYRAVTPESLEAAVKAHLVRDQRAVLVVKPKGAAPAPADAAGGAS